MKTAAALVLIFFLFFPAVPPPAEDEQGNCSTFLLKSGSSLYVGHNLDESPGLHVPGLVCVNPREAYREGMTWAELVSPPAEYEKALVPFDKKPGPKIRWVSKYGSITFNSEGLDFPDGGINEKGLSVFEMSLGETKHQADPKKPTLFMPLWIQYQLDNCASLDEVVRSAEDINIQGWSWHYFVSDSRGNAAIVEFLEGKPVVHRGEAASWPVLCNTRYSLELERLKEYQGFGGRKAVGGPFQRAPRFVRGAKMLQDYDPSAHGSPREYAMKILGEIKIRGWNKWAILIDVRDMTVTLHTDRNRKLRRFSFRDFDLSPGWPPRLLDIHSELAGNVAEAFVDYSHDRNHALTKERAKILFVERLKGLEANGVTAEIYARRLADYSRRMRGEK